MISSAVGCRGHRRAAARGYRGRLVGAPSRAANHRGGQPYFSGHKVAPGRRPIRCLEPGTSSRDTRTSYASRLGRCRRSAWVPLPAPARLLLLKTFGNPSLFSLLGRRSTNPSHSSEPSGQSRVVAGRPTTCRLWREPRGNRFPSIASPLELRPPLGSRAFHSPINQSSRKLHVSLLLTDGHAQLLAVQAAAAA